MSQASCQLLHRAMSNQLPKSFLRRLGSYNSVIFVANHDFAVTCFWSLLEFLKPLSDLPERRQLALTLLSHVLLLSLLHPRAFPGLCEVRIPCRLIGVIFGGFMCVGCPAMKLSADIMESV